MKRLRRLSLLTWLLLRSIPPVPPGRLLMPALFLSAWTVLRAFSVAEVPAFVLAGVLAQTAQLWAVLPVAVWHQRRLFARAGGTAQAALALYLAVIALQLWQMDPAISQRVVTVYCALYVATMLAGILGDRLFLDRFVPVSAPDAVPVVTRRHILKLHALVAVLVIVVNEILLAMAAPLGARVATLALLPVGLHVLFEIALFLTLPLDDD